MRVLVIGGRGHFGRRVVERLRGDGSDVLIGTRTPAGPPDVRFDLAEPSTFDVLGSMDVVVNTADSILAPPDDLIRRCLEEGPPLIETTACAATVRRLIDRFAETRGGGAAIVVGCGVFPGLSNLVAADAMAAEARADSVDLGIRLAIVSGSGAGSLRLARSFLCAHATEIRRGEPVPCRPWGRGPRLPFPRGEGATWLVDLAETPMLAHSLATANLRVGLAISPSIGAPFVGPLVRLVNLGRVTQRLAWGLIGPALALTRGGLLRRWPAGVEIVARAGTRWTRLAVRDGFGVAAEAVAAGARRIAAGEYEARLHMPDEAWTLEEILAEIERGDSATRAAMEVDRGEGLKG